MPSFIRPDYQQGCIVNIMSSIGQALGAEPGIYPPLPGLDGRLASRRIVLVVIDGLGYDFLKTQPDTLLARHLAGRITTVFPSTTATAITTYHTGMAPQQHAITGWFTWFRELGSVAAVLPFRPRLGGGSYGEVGVSPGQLLGAGPFAERIKVPSHAVSPAAVVHSEYSRLSVGPSERHGFHTMGEFFGTIQTLLQQEGPLYLFAYWSELDRLAHEHGIGSRAAAAHLHALDAAFAGFLEQSAGADATVIITADHGFVDNHRHIIRVEEHLALAQTLAIPLCGEPRAAFCFVRATRREQFLSYVRSELSACCELFECDQLIDEGWFGLGPPDPRLAQRIGDYVLMMKGSWVIRDRLINERPFSQVGVHGGGSAQEMYVPLAVLSL